MITHYPTPANARPFVPLAISQPPSDYGSPMRVMSELADAIAIQKAKQLELQGARQWQPFRTPRDVLSAPDACDLFRRLWIAVEVQP